MAITRARLNEYEDGLQVLVRRAQRDVRAAFGRYEPGGFAVALDGMMPVVLAASDVYGDMAATLAAELYEQTALDEAGIALDAQLADTFDHGALQVDVDYAARNHLFDGSGDRDGFLSFVDGVLDKAVKSAARGTISESAARDERTGVRYARVPQGPRTCAFCVMLASRGFVYASEASAGAYDKYHSFCDCEIVPSWDTGNPTLEGYDPDGMYDRYRACRETRGVDSMRYESGDERTADILSEMRTRDEGWLYDGTVPPIGGDGSNASAAVRSAARSLAENGFNVSYTSGDALLFDKSGELWDVRAGSGASALESAFTSSGSARVVLLWSGLGSDAIGEIRHAQATAGVPEALYIAADGTIRRIRL